MKQILIFTAVSKLALVSTVALLAACSSSDDSAPASAATPDSAAISGSVVAAPVSGASIQLKDAAGNALADPVTTGSDGSYSVTVSGAMPDALVLESTGGTYSDEASGAATDAGMLMAYVDGASMSAGGQLHATPASTIVYEMVNDGMTLSAAQAAFESAFGFAADTATAPTDATAPAADATDEELLAGLRAAAFSQLTKELGLAPAEQFDLLSALAEDLADGELDGELNGADVAITATVMMPIDIQSRFITALLNFHDSGLMGDSTTGKDMTGLDNSQIGFLPFAKVAMAGTTGAYKIEYVPGMMDPMQGKSMFKLRISDAAGSPVSSVVTLDLMMYMSDRRHSTPDLDCDGVAGVPGEYDCTVYYVMPSVDALGNSRGYWQIQATVDAKSTVFYPTVMMAMGDTTRTLLLGVKSDPALPSDDTISMMGNTASRPYNLFRNGLSGSTGNHDFELFIAPMVMMDNFPALTTGVTLNGTFLVNDVKVEFSTDAINWSEGVGYVGANGSGVWGVTGLTGLEDGVEGKIYVKLSVDDDAGGLPGAFEADELKTTTGSAPDGTNEYASFRVTP